MSYIKAALPSKSKKGVFHYAKTMQDSYYTLFSSYPTLLDYHKEQAKNSGLEVILKLYMPLIDSNSYLHGQLDEDLKQYILMHIAINISKFSF